MVVDAAVFVVDDEKRGAGPQCGISLDRHVYLSDVHLSGLNVVVRMLIICQLFTRVAVVVAVVWLDEAVIGQLHLGAVA